MVISLNDYLHRTTDICDFINQPRHRGLENTGGSSLVISHAVIAKLTRMTHIPFAQTTVMHYLARQLHYHMGGGYGATVYVCVC